MRTARVKTTGIGIYHCISRIVDSAMRMNDGEKERFRNLMRRVEGFSGAQVLTWTALDNHFHLLLYVPERREVSDKEFIRRLRFLYNRTHVGIVAKQLREYRKGGHHHAAATMKEQYTCRMYDLSEFLKTLKQRYTMSYNKRHDRKGTLWEERFKSVLIQNAYSRKDGNLLTAVAAVAAYIDLNCVRAGIVKDPREYRFCGYAEAIAGTPEARAGLLRVMGSMGPMEGWWEAAAAYRRLLYIRGEKTGTKAGFSREQVMQTLESGGDLTIPEVLRCRVRYFSDGLVLGSSGFVNDLLRRHGDKLGFGRLTEPRPMKHARWDGLHSARHLRRTVISLPAYSSA